jgi:ferritin heavy chain
LEKYFRESAEEEREHAQLLIGKTTEFHYFHSYINAYHLDYTNTRGGRVVLRALQAPEVR